MSRSAYWLLPLIAAPAWPQTLPQVSEQIVVVAPSQLRDGGLDSGDLPEASTVLGEQDIARTGIPSLTGAIISEIPGSSVSDVDGNPFQPDINFRGFTASPVAGTSQGIAVYVNGVRFNEAFGDTVNWDLIPPAAIRNVDIEPSNPLFGLNALGGALDVRLKDGFTFQGAQFTGYGGSFGRGSGTLEYGRQFGDFAVYASGDITHDDGFRQTQSSDLYRLFTDFGWRRDGAELHAAVTAASTALGNPGAAPVQALNYDLGSIFSGPNTVYNKYVSLNLNGNYAVNDTTTLQGVGYFQHLTQRIPNGVTEELSPCTVPGGLLCNDSDGSVVTTRGGLPVGDFLDGGIYSGLVNEGLDTQSYGFSGDISNRGEIAGRPNHFLVGGSFDGANSGFDAFTQIGGIGPVSHLFIGPGVTLNEPGVGINPVRVGGTTRNFGLFLDDLLTLAPGLDLHLAGRFNAAEIDLADKLGGPVRGQHSYNRFNPSAGLTWHILPALAVYGSYTETNRAPTPTELSCASAATPCSLLNFFVGDPNLKQVVARTFEAGVRGKLLDFRGGRLTWNADYYHTKTADDLYYESTIYNPNLAYYTNAGATRRQGAEANLRYSTERLRLQMGYAYTQATFQNYLTLNSQSNPAADANGVIHVVPGDRIPGIPLHRGTIVADYNVTDRWILGGSAVLQSSLYRFGDEANQTKPVGGYVLLGFNTSYRLTDNVTVFGLVNNLTDRRYDTYGTFGPVGDVPWNFVPGGVADSRTAVPGMPIAGYAGVKVRF